MADYKKYKKTESDVEVGEFPEVEPVVVKEPTNGESCIQFGDKYYKIEDHCTRCGGKFQACGCMLEFCRRATCGHWESKGCTHDHSGKIVKLPNGRKLETPK